MRPHAAASSSHENGWDRLHLRAQDLFVESETHSIIGSIQYSLDSEGVCVKEAGVESRPMGLSRALISNNTKLNMLLKASKLAPVCGKSCPK